jgi:hypothetical protein
MGFGDQGLGGKLFGRERMRVILSWFKGYNVKLQNLLPLVVRYMYIYVCVCVNMVFIYTARLTAKGTSFA